MDRIQIQVDKVSTAGSGPDIGADTDDAATDSSKRLVLTAPGLSTANVSALVGLVSCLSPISVLSNYVVSITDMKRYY